MKKLLLLLPLLLPIPLSGQATIGYHRAAQVIARGPYGVDAQIVPGAKACGGDRPVQDVNTDTVVTRAGTLRASVGGGDRCQVARGCKWIREHDGLICLIRSGRDRTGPSPLLDGAVCADFVASVGVTGARAAGQVAVRAECAGGSGINREGRVSQSGVRDCRRRYRQNGGRRRVRNRRDQPRRPRPGAKVSKRS